VKKLQSNTANHITIRPNEETGHLPSTWKVVHITCYLGGKFKQESRAVARKPRDVAAVLIDLKFTDIIHYKFKISQASKARLQSSKYIGTKQNLTQNCHSRRSFKVTYIGVSGKAIRD